MRPSGPARTRTGPSRRHRVAGGDVDPDVRRIRFDAFHAHVRRRVLETDPDIKGVPCLRRRDGGRDRGRGGEFPEFINVDAQQVLGEASAGQEAEQAAHGAGDPIDQFAPRRADATGESDNPAAAHFRQVDRCQSVEQRADVERLLDPPPHVLEKRRHIVPVAIEQIGGAGHAGDGGDDAGDDPCQRVGEQRGGPGPGRAIGNVPADVEKVR